MIACTTYIVSIVWVHRTLVNLSTLLYTLFRKLKSVYEKIIMRLLIILAFLIPLAFASESSPCLLQGIKVFLKWTDFSSNLLYGILRGHSTTTWTEFCHFLMPPPPCMGSFYTLRVDRNRYFLTPSPPHLAHLIIEWPLIKINPL